MLSPTQLPSAHRLGLEDVLRVPVGTDPLVDGLYMVVTRIGATYIKGIVPVEGCITKEVTLDRELAELTWAGSPVHARVC